MTESKNSNLLFIRCKIITKGINFNGKVFKINISNDFKSYSLNS